MGVIAATAAMVFSITVKTTDETNARFSESLGPKLVSVYWVPDVASAQRVNLNSGPCGGGTPIVTFSWADDRTGYGVVTASWAAESAGGTRRLVRRLCMNGDLSTPTSRVIVPEIADPGVTVSCDGAPCVEDATPEAVRIDVTTPRGYHYSLESTRQLRSTTP